LLNKWKQWELKINKLIKIQNFAIRQILVANFFVEVVDEDDVDELVDEVVELITELIVAVEITDVIG
jgi:hypothetical protein